MTGIIKTVRMAAEACAAMDRPAHPRLLGAPLTDGFLAASRLAAAAALAATALAAGLTYAA